MEKEGTLTTTIKRQDNLETELGKGGDPLLPT